MSRNMTVRLALQARTANDEQLMCLACGNFLHAGKHVEFVVMMNDGAPIVGLHRACMASVHHVRRRMPTPPNLWPRVERMREHVVDPDAIGTIDDDDEFAAAICGVTS